MPRSIEDLFELQLFASTGIQNLPFRVTRYFRKITKKVISMYRLKCHHNFSGGGEILDGENILASGSVVGGRDVFGGKIILGGEDILGVGVVLVGGDILGG